MDLEEVLWIFFMAVYCRLKGAYIKYVGVGAEEFYKFFKKFFVAQETVDLNIS